MLDATGGPAQAEAPHVVMFAPLPPKRNGIAAYTAEILGTLRHYCRCTVIVEDGSFTAEAPDGVAIMQVTEYLAHEAELATAVHVYQVGNNPDHVYMLPFLVERPGVVVLHDPSLHHLADCATLAHGDPQRYSAALESEYGVAGRLLAAQFTRYGLREQRMFFDLPMIRGVLGPARAVIVHSDYAAMKVLTQAPDANVHIVPHHFARPDTYRMEARDVVRRRLGVREDTLLFLSLGFVTRGKRIDLALRALAAIQGQIPAFHYVIAGELRPEETDVLALAESLGIAHSVSALGYVPEDDFFSLIGAADVVINLRHPIAGETSGTMVRALGSGACLVVVDRGPFAEIPDGAAVKLPWTDHFEQPLAVALRDLANDRALRARIGAAAQAFVLQSHTLQITVSGYLDAIRAAAVTPPTAWGTTVTGWEWPSASELARVARVACQSGSRPPLWVLAGAVPRAAGGCRTLIVTADAASRALLAGHLARVPDVSIDLNPGVVTTLSGLERRSVDLVLLVGRVSKTPSDLGALLRALNAVLAFGGLLVINLERDAQDRGIFLQRAKFAALFDACGFRLELATAAAPPELDLCVKDSDTDRLLEERCWRAVKVSGFCLRSTAHAVTSVFEVDQMA